MNASHTHKVAGRIATAVVMTAAAVLLGGCGGGKPDATELERAFKKAESGLEKIKVKDPAAPPDSQGAFDIDTFVKDTAEAMRNQDYERAADGLVELRSYPNLTGDQLTVVQDALAAVQTELVNRSSGGDKKAEQELERYRAQKRASRNRR